MTEYVVEGKSIQDVWEGKSIIITIGINVGMPMLFFSFPILFLICSYIYVRERK